MEEPAVCVGRGGGCIERHAIRKVGLAWILAQRGAENRIVKMTIPV